MTPHNNLDKTLRKALGDHPEPLREAQWERLQQALGEQKPKRRLIPFFWISALVLLVASGTYLLLNQGDDLKNKQEVLNAAEHQSSTAGTQEDSHASETNEKENIPLTSNGKPQSSNNEKENTAALASNNKNNEKGKTKNKENTPLASNSETQTPNNEKGKTKNEKENSSLASNDKPQTSNIDSNEKGKTENEEENTPLTSDDKPQTSNSEIQTSNLKPQTAADTTPLKKPLAGNTNDTTKEKRKKFTISFTAGYAPVNVKVTGTEEGQKLHKDTRSVYEQSNKNPQAFSASFAFDWAILPHFNLGLNSGIQYRTISTPVNVQYNMREVPFRNTDGSIMQYIPVGGNGIPLNANTVNKTTFISVPFRFNYTIPFNADNEMVLIAGTTITLVAGAKGSNIDVNQAEVKPLTTKAYKPVNMGWLGGLQYARRLRDPWWLGFETVWFDNRLTYKGSRGGSLKSNLRGLNLNLVLKYKF